MGRHYGSGMADVDGDGTTPQLEQKFRSLLDQQSESRRLDYKAAMRFEGPKARGEIAKCLLAFANSGGGDLVVGVKESASGFVEDPLSPDERDTWDPTALGNFLRGRATQLPELRVSYVPVADGHVVLVEISHFTELPIICSRDLDHEGVKILRSGALYVRTVDAKCQEVATADEMRDVVQRAVTRSGDRLLSQIRELVGPSTPHDVQSPTPEFSAEIVDSEAWFLELGLNGPAWQFSVHPVRYESERLARSRLRESRDRAAVSIRGWSVPHVDKERSGNFRDGIQSQTDFSRYREAHRAYRSGLFVWRRALAEDLAGGVPSQSLSYVSAIWSITEHLLFAARWASDEFESEDVVLSWRVEGITGRSLWVEPGSGIVLHDNYRSEEDELRREVQLTGLELKLGWEELAVAWAVELFELFNAELGAAVVEEWQAKFLERRF